MNTDVIGARMMPANSVPMPTSAYAPGSPVGNGATVCTSIPTAPPAIAPMYRLGAKMPPALPDAYDTIVATSLRKHSSTIVFSSEPAVERLVDVLVADAHDRGRVRAAARR